MESCEANFVVEIERTDLYQNCWSCMESCEANFVVEIERTGLYQNCWSCPLKFVLSAPSWTGVSSVCFKKPWSLFCVLAAAWSLFCVLPAALEFVLGTPQWPWSLDAPPQRNWSLDVLPQMPLESVGLPHRRGVCCRDEE